MGRSGDHVGSRQAPPQVGAGPPQFAPDQIATILEPLKGSNSIELKLVVPATGHRATIASIGLDPDEAQPRRPAGAVADHHQCLSFSE
jgi:hypothetical protein